MLIYGKKVRKIQLVSFQLSLVSFLLVSRCLVLFSVFFFLYIISYLLHFWYINLCVVVVCLNICAVFVLLFLILL